jgi:hypothetical protein
VWTLPSCTVYTYSIIYSTSSIYYSNNYTPFIAVGQCGQSADSAAAGWTAHYTVVDYYYSTYKYSALL